jgi:hypothetical protein
MIRRAALKMKIMAGATDMRMMKTLFNHHYHYRHGDHHTSLAGGARIVLLVEQWE